jgi:hypothetical protein
MLACVGIRIRIPLSISHLRYFLYVHARQSPVNEMFSENTIDADTPSLDSYDGRRRNVDEQGERLMSQLDAVDHVVEGIKMHGGFLLGNEHGGPHCDHHQVNDWEMFKGGTVHGEAKRGQEEGRKRTSVDSKRDDRNHQDNPTLIRTQNPSPPDDDTIGNDILNQNFRETGQFTRAACG